MEWKASLRHEVSGATDEEWAWAVGLFEGEGCIHVGTQGNRLIMNLTDEDVLQFGGDMPTASLFGAQANYAFYAQGRTLSVQGILRF